MDLRWAWQADIMKEIWKVMSKDAATPPQPLDEEMLSELAKTPAVVEGLDPAVWSN